MNADPDVDRKYRRFRVQEVVTMTVVYAIFYVCRLAFSAAKKDMIEQGAYTTEEIGWVGSSMLIAYAIGKCVNGFFADRANITRFMGVGLLLSALVNFAVGFHLPALVLIGLWFVNGWTQGMGAPACVVGLSRWFTKRERGTYYGIWSCSNNLGETLSYMLTAGVILSMCLADDSDQIAQMREVIEECPDLKVAVGHFGMVTGEHWMEQIRLAHAPNVFVESGGITWLFNSEFYPFKGAVKAIREAADEVGMDKLMWGSDYPRTICAITYRMSYDFILKSDLLSDDEKSAFLGGNAVKFYGFRNLPELPYIKNMSE